MECKKYIYYILLSFLFIACAKEEQTPLSVDKKVIEVNAEMNKLKTRSILEGNSFVNGDSFTLYEGVPAESGVKKSPYNYIDSKWTGDPGLYWDDLSIWDTDGIIKTTNFTAVLTNGGTLDFKGTDPTFTINPAPASEEEFLKSDLLVAYTTSDASLSALKLTFNHVMARLRIEITDLTTDDDGQPILGNDATLKLNAFVGNTITFHPGASPSTTIATTADSEVDVTLLCVGSQLNESEKTNTYFYEIILPAQSLRESTLTITGHNNDKTYTYPLSQVTVDKVDTKDNDILTQGNKTTLSLKLEKTELTLVEVVVTQWVEKTASGVATPDDYPTIVIGGGDDDGEPSIPDDKDDYAGKVIKLTKDITLEDLKKEITIPLGSKAVPFRGTFDGQGFTISAVEMEGDKDKVDFLGIFGYTDGASIKNLNVEGTGIKNADLSSSTATGGLIGYANNTKIENCHVKFTGSVEAAYDNAGGLVGYANGNTSITGCSASTNVKAGHDYAGGLVGLARKGVTITHSFSEKREEDAGKFAVEAEHFYAGGLVGACYDVDVKYSYSWSDAQASRYAGGLIGRYESTTGNVLINCYAAGSKIKTISNANEAGMVAYIDAESGTANKCYWNSALGIGFIGTSQGGTNSSFALSTTLAAMNNLLNALNNDGTSVEWELTRTDYGNYVLPTLLTNKGEAEH